MNILFYKEYFQIELRHESEPGISCTSFSLTPDIHCQQIFRNFKMIYRKSPGSITIFYSGLETADHSNILAPFPTVSNGTEFLFIVSADNKNILNITKTPQEAAINAEDLGTVIPSQFIRPAVFSFVFDQTASTKLYEQLNVETEAGDSVYQTIIKKNKEINGEYLCSVDLSFSDPGIYSLRLGSKSKKFYVDTTGEIAGNYGFIRFKKDVSWLNPTNLSFGAPIDYNQFVYTFNLLP